MFLFKHLHSIISIKNLKYNKMKFQLKSIVAVVAITLAFVSCSKDEEEVISGNGNLKLEYDNVYGGANFAFATEYTNSNGEKVKASQLKYIVSNIVLTKEDGSTFTYPKSSSYFIVDEATAASQILNLTNVPAGNYTKVKFGIGVDRAQWELGATGQGDFLATAQSAGMMWSWTGGYKFVNFEGTVTSTTLTTPRNYRVHTGKTMVNNVENYNYAEVTITLPTTAKVRTTITPQIHILADAKNIVDGDNKIALTAGTSGDVMGGDRLALVTANLSKMFTVDHVHND
jgi:hypothetical protein